MALPLMKHMFDAFGELRFHPLQTRLRARLDDEQVLDSTAGLVVWEPKRVVPGYAVPVDDLTATLEPSAPLADEPSETSAIGEGPPILTPAVSFQHHSTPGTPFDVRTSGGATAPGAAFRPDDPDLAHVVFLEFPAFRWWEEETECVGHPRDPFHRIDVRPLSRHVEVSLDGRTLASSDRARILTETGLPPRFYFPREDVATDLLAPSDHQTTCAYKGHTHHLTAAHAEDGDSVAWVYEEPLDNARDVAGLVAFYNERVDVSVDGVALERPRTPWDRARHH